MYVLVDWRKYEVHKKLGSANNKSTNYKSANKKIKIRSANLKSAKCAEGPQIQQIISVRKFTI
jgi:hypothetical protein